MLSSGKIFIKRIDVKVRGTVYEVPLEATNILIKNVGISDVKFRIETNSKVDFFTIDKATQLPPITVLGETKLYFESILEIGKLEILAWG